MLRIRLPKNFTMAFKIYTKTGDEGSTALIGGTRVSKSHTRIDAYGNIDELNAHIGLLMVYCGEGHAAQPLLAQVQDRLFTLGSALACDPDKKSKLEIPELEEADVELLEQAIDEMETGLPALKNFVMPGGSLAASQAHVARCVCRRAERGVVQLVEQQSQAASGLILRYLNRLSDYLFVLSRFLLQQAGVEARLWKPRG